MKELTTSLIVEPLFKFGTVLQGMFHEDLSDYDTLYGTPIDKDLIGISSHKVGLSTLTGEYVGIT